MSIKDFNDPDFIGNTGNYVYDNLTDRDNMIDASKNLKATIKYMRPDTYIEKCAKLMGTSIDDQLGAINEKIVDDLVNKLNSNTKLDLPYLDYKSKSQEGRHRAIAIKKLSRSTLPVLIITKYNKKLHYSEVSDMKNIKKDINFAEKKRKSDNSESIVIDNPDLKKLENAFNKLGWKNTKAEAQRRYSDLSNYDDKYTAKVLMSYTAPEKRSDTIISYDVVDEVGDGYKGTIYYISHQYDSGEWDQNQRSYNPKDFTSVTVTKNYPYFKGYKKGKDNKYDTTESFSVRNNMNSIIKDINFAENVLGFADEESLYKRFDDFIDRNVSRIEGEIRHTTYNKNPASSFVVIGMGDRFHNDLLNKLNDAASKHGLKVSNKWIRPAHFRYYVYDAK